MTEEFIRKSILVHGDKYDYSKTEYVNNLKEVIIICKEHGEFSQLPKTHKRGNGCIDCGRERTSKSRKMTTEEFIEKSIELHGDKYDYSKTEYVKSSQKVIIICKEHGEFEQTPNGNLGNSGCKKCANKINGEKQRKTNEQFIEEAIKIHGNTYDYSKVEYVNSNTNVIIICKEHGECYQSPHNHLTGKGCYECSILVRSKKKTKTTKQFIEEAILIHKDKYDYSIVDYVNCNINVIIICKEHGNFLQKPTDHLCGHGCQLCGINKLGKWKLSNTQTFIEKAVEVHEDTYDYSKTHYIESNTKIIIICKKHGEFLQTPNSHLRGSGCNLCGINLRSKNQSFTINEFINKSKIIHEGKYDYSNVEYINNHTKVNIICIKHGIFEQTPQGHLSGRGCIKCANKYNYTTKEWIDKAIKIHGDIYDYSNVEYISAKNSISIICKIHGIFKQMPQVHLRPAGCYLCNPTRHSKSQIKWLDFISSYNQIKIQHAENEGEYVIPSTKYSADGYCLETNTIYEFHGDFWHGNPTKFNPTDINPISNKTFGELYQRTLDREQEIKNLGYNLIIIWENDWNKLNKSIKKIQNNFRNRKHYIPDSKFSSSEEEEEHDSEEGQERNSI